VRYKKWQKKTTLVEDLGGKSQLGKPKSNWEDIIKINFKGMCERPL
jgi:hypothetical protein